MNIRHRTTLRVCQSNYAYQSYGINRLWGEIWKVAMTCEKKEARHQTGQDPLNAETLLAVQMNLLEEANEKWPYNPVVIHDYSEYKKEYKIGGIAYEHFYKFKRRQRNSSFKLRRRRYYRRRTL